MTADIALTSLLIISSATVLILEPLGYSTREAPVPFRKRRLLLSALTMVQTTVFYGMEPTIIPIVHLLSEMCLT